MNTLATTPLFRFVLAVIVFVAMAVSLLIPTRLAQAEPIDGGGGGPCIGCPTSVDPGAE